MAKNVQSPKPTAGGGYVFEDYMVAFLLCRMLSNSNFLEPEDGLIHQIEFQVRVHGWFLDDALLTLNIAGTGRNCAISLKSAKQVTENGFSQEFVSSVWEQYLGGHPFEKDRDLLCLVTSPLAEGVSAAVSTLLQWARTQDPAAGGKRIETPFATNKTVRSLYKGWECPDQLSGKLGAVPTPPLEVLRHVRVVECDFERDQSVFLDRAVELCRGILRSHSLTEALKLWNTLCAIAAYYRPRAGSLRIEKLVDILRPKFALKNFPAHEEDWQKIRRYSEANIQQIRDTIGNRVSLDREEELQELSSSVTPRGITLLSGPSGSGKTVFTKKFVQSKASSATVVWWNASLLNAQDYWLFESRLNLVNPLEEIIGKLTAQDAYLVVDGLDRQVHEQVFDNLGMVIRFLHLENRNCPWTVIIPAQDEEIDRLYYGLLKVKIPSKIVGHAPTSHPSVEQLAPVWNAFPSLERLARRPELHTLLLKPKVLDLFASRIAWQEQDLSQWTGESDLIQWFWTIEVMSGPSSHVRDGFIKLLAGHQADRCDPEVPSDTFAPSDLGPLDGLIQDRICIAAGERYRFEHDLYGDWARQRILLGRRRDLAQFVEERLNSPFWHRPLRLLGVHLLEQESADSWREAYDQVSARTDEGTLAGDLLLESVIFAANPLPLLETMWNALSANGGLLLNRLLGRFLHVASSANALIVSMSRALRFEATNRPATWDRIPIADYWPPMIRFLHHHKAIAVEIAPLQVARVCERWLSAGSLEDARAEAAELALDMAEARLSAKIAFWRGVHDEELDRIVFRAALESLNTAPERTKEFTLIACGRKAPSGSILEMVLNLQRNTENRSRCRLYGDDWVELPLPRASLEYNPESNLPDPWPGGPTRIVDDAFRQTTLATNALVEFMKNDPALAAEIILACLVASPCEATYSYRHSSGNKFGLVGDTNYFWPPFFGRTPFLPFLMVNPSTAVDLIIRLVDFVTERRTEGRKTSDLQPIGVALFLEHSSQEFVGDASVFRWYRGLGGSPYAAATALMALENWLYDQLNQGISVSTPIIQILTKSHSVAFLGLLCCVGKRNPELFKTELKPLLAVPELYLWDIEQTTKTHESMIPWMSSDPYLKRLAHRWHNLPHRTHDLTQIAFELFLESKEMSPFFETVRLNWAARLEAEREAGNSSRFLEHLAVLFGPANRDIGDKENGNGCRMDGTEPTADDESEDREQRLITLLLVWPDRLWRLLTRKETLSEMETVELWNQLSAIQEFRLPEDFDVPASKIEDCLAGGAAVLLKHRRQWLADHAENEAWCISTILRLVPTPPTPSSMGSDLVGQQGRWRGFCAAILPTLLVEQPDSAEMRRAVATMATDTHYSAVGILLDSAAALREKLGEDFMRLQHIVLRWAVAGWARLRATFFECSIPGFEKWLHSEIEQFVQTATPTGIPDWHTIRESVDGCLPIEEPTVPVQLFRKAPGMDVQTIMRAYSWVNDLDGARSEEDRESRIQFFQQALRCSLELFAELIEMDDEFCRADYDWARWLFDRLARVIPSMREDEHPEQFWQPILDLGVHGHDWIAMFFASWFTENLTLPERPLTFFTQWCQMMDFAGLSENWKFEHIKQNQYHDLSMLWCSLMGLRESEVALWTEVNRATVDQMRDRYTAWAADHLGRSRCAENFGVFLRQPAAESLRCDGVVWFASAAGRIGVPYFSHARVEESIASFLDLCWSRHASAIRSSTAVFNCFNRLLRMLADRQNKTAMEILQRIATSTETLKYQPPSR